MENASAGDIYRQIESIQRDNQIVERAKQVIENKNNKIRKFEADREIEKAAIERSSVLVISSQLRILQDLKDRL